jgi:hypothetical protein
MFAQAQTFFPSEPSRWNSVRGSKRDILWDRPVFPPPVLPNPRVIFDPLPFTVQRPCAFQRPAAGR